jgi:pimeloyl-ACP methyl ester carboxylesterase
MQLIKWILLIIFAFGTALTAFVYLAPFPATNMLLNAERTHSRLDRKEITLADGMHYVYLEGGDGDALMLLHGFGADKDSMTRVARWLTPHYRVVIPDLLGFGESSHPADADYATAAQAQRLRNLAQSLGINKLHLGGNSMGGQIALAYAAAHPDEVSSLWLLDTGGIWSAPESELAKLLHGKGRNPLIARTEEEFVSNFPFFMSDPPFIPDPILRVIAQGQINHVDLSEKIFNQIVADSLENRVAGLQTPTLIVWGDQDRVIHPGTARILGALMPKSRVIIMQGTGHLPMLEKPHQCAADYLQFRRQLP